MFAADASQLISGSARKRGVHSSHLQVDQHRIVCITPKYFSIAHMHVCVGACACASEMSHKLWKNLHDNVFFSFVCFWCHYWIPLMRPYFIFRQQKNVFIGVRLCECTWILCARHLMPWMANASHTNYAPQLLIWVLFIHRIPIISVGCNQFSYLHWMPCTTPIVWSAFFVYNDCVPELVVCSAMSANVKIRNKCVSSSM